MEIITRERVKSLLKERNPKGDKFAFGSLLVIAGSEGYTGAPFFAATAAALSGVGLVRLVVPETIWAVEAMKLDSVMVSPVEDDDDGRISTKATEKILDFARKSSAVLIGPGCGINKGIQSLLKSLLTVLRVPLLIDADGLNVLSEDIDILKYAVSDVILTPHKKEFARLYGEKIIPNNKTLQKFAYDHNVTVVYKEAETRIATADNRLIINRGHQNSGLAKGGSGDVLAGIIASFLAQGYSAADSTIIGVYLHSIAGEEARKDRGERSMLPSDVMNHIPTVLRNL